MSAGRTGQGPVFRLLIGDQAIRFRAEHGERYHYWDLAETWTKMTSLPFAFAFWVNSPGNRKRQKRSQINCALFVIATSPTSMSSLFLNRKYLRRSAEIFTGSIFSLISVEREKAGLREFHRRCLLNKIDVAPDLRLNLV